MGNLNDVDDESETDDLLLRLQKILEDCEEEENLNDVDDESETDDLLLRLQKILEDCEEEEDVLELTVCMEDECPVCLEDFIPVASAKCGHHVCVSCCRGMHATGRTLTCPLCRDTRFGALVEWLTR